MRQAILMTGLNLLSLPQRWGSAVIDVFGVACVVAVFVGLFSVVASYRALLLTGSDDSVLIVLKGGTGAENESLIPQTDAAAVATAARRYAVRGRPTCAAVGGKPAADERAPAPDP